MYNYEVSSECTKLYDSWLGNLDYLPMLEESCRIPSTYIHKRMEVL